MSISIEYHENAVLENNHLEHLRKMLPSDVRAIGELTIDHFSSFNMTLITDLVIYGNFTKLPEIIYAMPLKTLSIDTVSPNPFIVDDGILTFSLESLQLSCVYGSKIEPSGEIDNFTSVIPSQIYEMATLKQLYCENKTRIAENFEIDERILNLITLETLILDSYGGQCFNILPECLAKIRHLSVYDCYWSPKSYFKHDDYMHIFKDFVDHDYFLTLSEDEQKCHPTKISDNIKCLTISDAPICGLCYTGEMPNFSNVIADLSNAHGLEILRINSHHFLSALLENIGSIPTNLHKIECSEDLREMNDGSVLHSLYDVSYY